MSRINCFNCIDGKENHCDGCNLYKISLNINKTIDALKKQVPKKPIAREHNELKGEILFHCPTCDDDFNCNEYEERYCPECGQALKWSDEE